MALQLLALASAAHTSATTCIYIHMSTVISPSEVFFPMASAYSVPRVPRRYHYEHAPPPSESVELMEDLRRGLRGVPKGGFWSKVKSVGWRLLREHFISFLCTVNDADENHWSQI